MLRLYSLLLAIFIGLSASSQVEIAGFGGPMALIAGFNLPENHSSDLGAFIGAQAGLVLNEKYEIAIYGAGRVNEITRNYSVLQEDRKLTYNQGGASFGYLGFLSDRIQLIPGLYAGIGRIRIKDVYNDWVGLFSPRGGIQLQIVHFMRLEVNAGYQIVLKVNDGEYENSNFNAPFGTLTLKFGAFGKKVEEQ